MRKSKSKTQSAAKTSKIQLRLLPDQMAVLVRAAEMGRTSLSNFILEHACEAAQQMLAEQVDIVMPPSEWDAFHKALDGAPRKISVLQRLLIQASVFDEPNLDRCLMTKGLQ